MSVKIEMDLRPSDILYSQCSISNKLSDTDTLIGVLLDDIVAGRCFASALNRIEVAQIKGKWMSANNRRLWILKQLEILGEITSVRVKMVKGIYAHKITSLNGGRSIKIRGEHPGGTTYDDFLLKDAEIITQNEQCRKKTELKCQTAIDNSNTDSSKITPKTKTRRGSRGKKRSNPGELTTKYVTSIELNTPATDEHIDGSHVNSVGELVSDTNVYCQNDYGTEHTDDFLETWIRRTEFENKYQDYVSNEFEYFNTDSDEDSEEVFDGEYELFGSDIRSGVTFDGHKDRCCSVQLDYAGWKGEKFFTQTPPTSCDIFRFNNCYDYGNSSRLDCPSYNNRSLEKTIQSNTFLGGCVIL